MELLPTLAEALIEAKGLAIFGASLGAGLAVIGASKGIGGLASSALEGQARQPEMAGRLFTTMLVAAALIEGFTFFALIICMLVLIWLR
ncbi:MAG TPA: ATP synthase F0 subunit C [Phycisphaerae bacterium]|nr:ATP synthase F0 subunit C [Phycisphaerae bacterium]